MLDFRKSSLIILLLVSGVYVTVLYALFAPISEVVVFLKSAPFNERGDFLAGIFGPLAVAWLVVGYFMQSYELKLQREEFARQSHSDELTHSLEMRRSDPRVHIVTNSKRNALFLTFLDNNSCTRLAVHIVDTLADESKIVGILDRTTEGGVWEISLENFGIALNSKRHKLWISYLSISNGQRVQEFELYGTGSNILIIQNGVVYTPL